MARLELLSEAVNKHNADADRKYAKEKGYVRIKVTKSKIGGKVVYRIWGQVSSSTKPYIYATRRI